MRPNRRTGRCLDCGGNVEPGQGTIRRVGSKEWGAVHHEGQHSAPPSTMITLPRARVQGRTNRFATNCAGCGDPVGVGRGTERNNVILCEDCSYGAS